MRVRICSMILFCLLGVAVAQAATVTVAIAQNATAPVMALEMSRTVEDEIMGIYFDSGHIVTSNALSMNDSSFDDLSFGVAEASEGFADYLITTKLTYTKDEKTDELLKISYAELQTISWRVIRISTGKMIAGKTVKLREFKSVDSDPYLQARAAAKKIALDAMKEIDKDIEGDTNR